MRLLIVHHYALPPKSAGGTRHATLAKWLVRRGHSVTIIASRHAYTGAQIVSENAEDTIDGVRFLWSDEGGRGTGIGGRGLGMVRFARDAYRLALKEVQSGERWDLVLGSSPQPFAALAASILARKLKRPFVLEIRDLWPLSLRDLAGWGAFHPGWLFLRQIEKFLYRRAAHIITVLPNSMDWISASGGSCERISVVCNGIDATALPTPSPVVEKQTFTCVYAGTHGIANGLDTLVHAAARVAQLPGGERVRIRLIGNGPTKSDLQALAAQLEVRNVEFYAPVSKKDVPDQLAQADACILHLKRMPAFSYGISPNKLFDYLAAGRPVIYAVEAANDPVSDAGAGLTIRSEDPDVLAQAMLTLSQTSQKERQDMGEKGYQYVIENHDWSVLSDRMENIFKEVLARG